jgi:hypothetical protein
LFGKFKVKHSFSFIFILPSYQSQRESSFLCAILRGIIKGEIDAVTGENDSVLEIVIELSDFIDLKRPIFGGYLVEGNIETKIDCFDALVFTNDCYSVVDTVPADVSYILFKLNAADLKTFFFF